MVLLLLLLAIIIIFHFRRLVSLRTKYILYNFVSYGLRERERHKHIEYRHNWFVLYSICILLIYASYSGIVCEHSASTHIDDGSLTLTVAGTKDTPLPQQLRPIYMTFFFNQKRQQQHHQPNTTISFYVNIHIDIIVFLLLLLSFRIITCILLLRHFSFGSSSAHSRQCLVSECSLQ